MGVISSFVDICTPTSTAVSSLPKFRGCHFLLFLRLITSIFYWIYFWCFFLLYFWDGFLAFFSIGNIFPRATIKPPREVLCHALSTSLFISVDLILFWASRVYLSLKSSWILSTASLYFFEALACLCSPVVNSSFRKPLGFTLALAIALDTKVLLFNNTLSLTLSSGLVGPSIFDHIRIRSVISVILNPNTVSLTGYMLCISQGNLITLKPFQVFGFWKINLSQGKC